MALVYNLYKNTNLKLTRLSFFTYLIVALALLFIGLQDTIPVDKLTRDTNSIFKGKFYYGLISNIGLFLWCASGAVYLFSYILLNKTISYMCRRFLLAAAAISFMLLADDLLMLHEQVFPQYLGVSEIYLYTLYALMLTGFTLYFYRIIMSSQALLFLSGMFFLGLSIVSDLIMPQTGRWIMLEDGLKLMGIIGWFSYTVHTCIAIIQDKLKVRKRWKNRELKVLKLKHARQLALDKI